MTPNDILILYDNVVDVDKLTVSVDPAEPEWIVFSAKEALHTSRVYIDEKKAKLLVKWLAKWLDTTDGPRAGALGHGTS